MFPLKVQDQIKLTAKIQKNQITAYHHEIISSIQYKDERLFFLDNRWTSMYLGSGEEKAVFCVIDHQNLVFALELIDEKNYMNGRVIGGEYFFEKRVASLTNIKLKSNSVIGLTFTGLIKVREFIHGYEWDRFQFVPDKHTNIDPFITYGLQSAMMAEFKEYQALYKDVHGRNVMFEIKSPTKKGIPMLVRDWYGKINVVKIGLRAIDVR